MTEKKTFQAFPSYLQAFGNAMNLLIILPLIDHPRNFFLSVSKGPFKAMAGWQLKAVILSLIEILTIRFTYTCCCLM